MVKIKEWGIKKNSRTSLFLANQFLVIIYICIVSTENKNVTYIFRRMLLRRPDWFQYYYVRCTVTGKYYTKTKKRAVFILTSISVEKHLSLCIFKYLQSLHLRTVLWSNIVNCESSTVCSIFHVRHKIYRRKMIKKWYALCLYKVLHYFSIKYADP